MICTSTKNRTPHDNEIWQCDSCTQIFIGTLANKAKTKYENYYKSKKKPIISENPYEAACRCCSFVTKIAEEGDKNE